MTLGKLILYIALVSIVVTAVTYFVFGKKKNAVLSYLQNFCGVLFIWSGFVKAVDPLGTAYKMEQYFTEFETTFSETWMSFIAPLFPFLSDYSAGFAVFMVVLELVLGAMLILGSRTKLTAWLFFFILIFFTFLTGFTYLTGYVPPGGNFFDFGSWVGYDANNMKVTDCGCFGDYLKLEPKTSFFKDVFLLIPGVLFLFVHKRFHQLFNVNIRTIILSLFTIGFLYYCLSNFVFDIPGTDFRPFKKGTDVVQVRNAEEASMASVKITAWKLQNKETKEFVEISNEVYMADFSKPVRDYPKEKFEIVDQIKTKPLIKPTKISDFEIKDLDGNDSTYEILENEKPVLLLVCNKMYARPYIEEVERIDTLYRLDTLVENNVDTIFTKVVEKTIPKSVKVTKFDWDKDYLEKFGGNVKEVILAAHAEDIDVKLVAGQSSNEMLEDFKAVTNLPVSLYSADDILLKTIVRSNPGIVLWKNGVIVDKWHEKKLPYYSEIKKTYLK